MNIFRDILDEQEHVYGVFRQHSFFLIGRIITEIVLVGLAVFVMAMIGVVLPKYDVQAGIWSVVASEVLLVIVAALVISAIIDVYRWRYSATIITNRRLIRCEGIFQRSVTDMSLQRISEITMTQSLWGRIVGYADFLVTSESETGQEIRGVVNPIAFRTALDDARVGEARDFGRGTDKQH